ncbi:MAG: hypothetical protein U0354_12825 [Candidatus Sericytochromatia bacterium]
MNKLPQDYINFIAKGIVHNLGVQDIPIKDNYSEEDLMFIFQCKTSEELYNKISEIEEKTLQALGLPVKDSYSTEELAAKLNFAPGMLESMNTAFESFPEHNTEQTSK